MHIVHSFHPNLDNKKIDEQNANSYSLSEACNCNLLALRRKLFRKHVFSNFCMWYIQYGVYISVNKYW